MKVLNVSYQDLTVLPELPLSLTELDCRGNQLTSLPELPLSLTELCCSSNRLTSLPELPFGLIELRCYGNNFNFDINIVSFHSINSTTLIVLAAEVVVNAGLSLGQLPSELIEFINKSRGLCNDCQSVSAVYEKKYIDSRWDVPIVTRLCRKCSG